MDCKTFMWHAKRGHGDCFIAIKEEPSKFRKCVEKVFLTNYAFLLEDEYRSSFAYELMHGYNDDLYFLQKLWKKLLKTSLTNYYSLDYLVNNLYFVLKNNKAIDYTKKIQNILIRRLKKNFFSVAESKSIQSLLCLIIDLKMNIDFDTVVKNHFDDYSKSNLDLFDIDYCYGLTLSKRKNIQHKSVCKQYNYEEILCFLADDNLTDDDISMFSVCVDYNSLHSYCNIIKSDSVSNQLKTNILKLLYYSSLKIPAVDLLSILSSSSKFDVKLKKIVYGIFFNAKSVPNLTYFGIADDCFFICAALKKYNKVYYSAIHKRISRIRINYSDSDLWFEVENSLIQYFKRKNVDPRLLADLEKFMDAGLCSTSRLEIARILKKYRRISESKIKRLKYDANYKIRKMFKRNDESQKPW